MPGPTLAGKVTLDDSQAEAAFRRLTASGAAAAAKLEATVGGAFKSLAVGPVAALGAAMAAAFEGKAIASGVAQMFDAGRSLQVLSRQTGASATGLAILGAKFNAAGLSAETVGRSIFRLQKSIAGLEDDENKGGPAAIEKLGLSLASLQKLSPDQELFAVGSAISRIQDSSERGATAMQIFGRAGAELGALFNGRGFGEITPSMAINARVLAASSAAFEQTSIRLSRAGDVFKSFYLGAAVGLTKGLTPVLDQLERINLVVVGQKFGAGLVTGAQAFVGAFKNPGALADAFFYRFAANEAQFANQLIAGFRYAGESLVAVFHALPAIATHLTDGIGYGLLAAAEKFTAAALSGVSKASEIFSAGIDWVSTHGIGALGTRLLQAASTFAAAMASAITSPLTAIGKIAAQIKESLAQEGQATLATALKNAANGAGFDLGGALDERAGVNAGKAAAAFAQAASLTASAMTSPKFTVPDVTGAGALSARAAKAFETMRAAGAATIGTAAPTSDGPTRQPSFADHVGMANMKMALASSGISTAGMDPGQMATLAQSHMFMGDSAVHNTAWGRTNATDPYTARVDAARAADVWNSHTIGVGGALDFNPATRPGWTGAKDAGWGVGGLNGPYGGTAGMHPEEAIRRKQEADRKGATSSDIDKAAARFEKAIKELLVK